MKKSEKPFIPETKSKEEIDRGKAIREDFMCTLNQEITHTKLQMTFCSPESAEYRYHTETLRLLYNQRENYGKS